MDGDEPELMGMSDADLDAHAATADTFAGKLKSAIEAKPKKGSREKKILAVIDSPPSKKRTRKLARWERHAVAEFGKSGAIDWESFNWDKFLENLLALISLLMKLFV